MGHFNCSLKQLNINIVQNCGHIQNKSIVCRPGIYNLQARTATFPDQEKLLGKVDLRYLKTPQNKKLHTENTQIKNCPCSKCVMI